MLPLTSGIGCIKIGKNCLISMSTTLNTLRNTPNLKDRIVNILSNKFIYVEPVAEILASAIYSGQNVILFGPGGHGKSEMVEEVLLGLGLWNRTDASKSETLIQSFGEGLTEDALWGGIDFTKLNSATKPEMSFHVENSFLNYPVAVFEELFDAPPFCLLPLKHTIQAGFLGKNGRNFPMKTELIIACTNKNPEDIAEMGETYKALLERFVLRQEVMWKSYNSGDYEKLINKHTGLRMEATERSVLCSLMADCQDAGHTISPRTAMKAVDILIGSAKSRGSKDVVISDLASLKHVVGFQQMAMRFEESMQLKKAEAEARLNMQTAINDFERLKNDFGGGLVTKVIDWCVLAKRFFNMNTTFGAINVPDSLYEQRSALQKETMDYFMASRDKAIELTRV